MTAPKLIGMFRLPLPRANRNLPADCGYAELINLVGVDVDGQAWGLVLRNTPIPGDEERPAYLHAARVEYVRWVRFDAIAFAPDEVVTDRAWETPPATPAADDDDDPLSGIFGRRGRRR